MSTEAKREEFNGWRELDRNSSHVQWQRVIDGMEQVCAHGDWPEDAAAGDPNYRAELGERGFRYHTGRFDWLTSDSYVPRKQACAVPAPAVVTPEPTGGGKADDCPHRWMHGVMTCPHCGLAERVDDTDALRHELNDWRQFGFAHVGPPVTCDQDMRDGIEEQLRALGRMKAAEGGKAQAEGWVSVEERLPELIDDPGLTTEAWSLVMAPGRGVDMASWDGERWIWRGHGYAIPSEVTHWMPLPAPPTSGGNK